MLIKQVIEFEWRGSGPPGRTCTLITAYFYYLLPKYCSRQCVLVPPTWAKSFTKFSTKM